MPRLLPRLLKGLADRGLEPESYRGPLIEKRRRCRSLWRPIKSTHKLFSISGRTHSLLLDRENILISPRQYARHKTMPPAVRLNDQVLAKHSVDSHDKPREMTMEERQNWTSPYRMYSRNIFRNYSKSSYYQCGCYPLESASASFRDDTSRQVSVGCD